MSDRLFTDCCYGTEAQHGPSATCPQDAAIRKVITAYNTNPDRPFDDVGGVRAYHRARMPILAKDVDFEIVSISGVQGCRLTEGEQA